MSFCFNPLPSSFRLKINCYWRSQPWVRILAGIAILVIIYGPELAHYYVPNNRIPDDLVNSLTQMPSDAILTEVSEENVGVPLLPSSLDEIQAARNILKGQLIAPGFSSSSIKITTYPADLHQGPPTLRLILASFEIERILLRSFEETGEREFLDAALNRIRVFDEYERERWTPDNFIWNDHAVASRVSVLAFAWKIIRTTGYADPKVTAAILSQARRTGIFLSRADHFTVRTNHGVMQNLALLQLASAFPKFPEAVTWDKLALQRLERQLPFYVSSEGVVLEHSATYQHVGAELLARFVRLLAKRDLTPTEELRQKADASLDILQKLFRPDGSLPLLGNTPMATGFAPVSSGGNVVPPPNPDMLPKSLNTLLPVSGYSIWWTPSETGPVQTISTWAKHDGHGHKHADELSVHLWRDGINWLTATGYWPYGYPGMQHAYSWTGANAPHLVGESAESKRTNRVLGHAEIGELRTLDLERTGPSGLTIRRQLIQIGGETLIVLDFASDPSTAQVIQTIWTFDPRLESFRDEADTSSGNEYFSFQTPNSNLRLNMLLAGNFSGMPELVLGRHDPFSGWVVVDRNPTPAPAVVVKQATNNGAAAYVFHFTNKTADKEGMSLTVSPGAQPEQWSLLFFNGSRRITLTRNLRSLSFSDSLKDDKLHSFDYKATQDISEASAGLRDSFIGASKEYPYWRDLYFYRERLALIAGALMLMVELSFILIAVFWNSAETLKLKRLNYGVVAAWAASGYWAHFIYLV